MSTPTLRANLRRAAMLYRRAVDQAGNAENAIELSDWKQLRQAIDDLQAMAHRAGALVKEAEALAPAADTTEPNPEPPLAA